MNMSIWDLNNFCFRMNFLGLLTEGIFRLSGAAPEVEQLRHDFDRPPTYGKYLDLRNNDIHAIAGVVKKYLRQLPDPPIPLSCHDKFIRFFGKRYPCFTFFFPLKQKIDESYSNKATIRAFASMIQQLPREHFHLVQYIIILTSSIQKHADTNMMNSEALAIVLAPVCTGLELNLKEIPSWMKRHTRAKTSDMNRCVEVNTKWTRIWTLLIEYSDTLLELWKDTLWEIPTPLGCNTVPCRPSFSAMHQNSLSSFQEHETDLLTIAAPIKPPTKRTSSSRSHASQYSERKELYKVVIMRPRYTSKKSQKNVRRASVIFDEDEDVFTKHSNSTSTRSFKSSLFSRSSVSLGNPAN